MEMNCGAGCQRPLRIALTKGRLEQDSVDLFSQRGIDCSELEHKGRRLLFPLDGGKIEAVLAKAPDVITYVERGVCDIGIVGKDTIIENGHSFYEVLDLGFGKCRFVLAAPKARALNGGSIKKVASKYPNITRRFFEKKKLDVEIIKIEGSVELAPLLGLTDAIVDITETGRTLVENGLEIIEDVCEISARMIVNIASMKMRAAEINELMTRIS